MNELIPNLAGDIEETLAKYYSAPAPSAEFALHLEMQLRWKMQHRQKKIILTHRESFMQVLRNRPVLTILIAVLILLVLSGVAYAIGKSLGYVPGLGIVDQSAPLRVLAEPVSQTRDGIAVTVKEAIISADKTIVTFTVENVPPDKLSPINESACTQWPALRLPDGTVLKLTGGEGNVVAPKYEMRLIYEAVSPDINNATLLIPCIDRAAPDVLPENWELPLSFTPAPPDMTVVPVMEVTPGSVAGPAEGNPLTITEVIDVGDSYIITGEFQASPPPNESDSGLIGLRVTDGNGDDIPFEALPQDIAMPTPTSPNTEVWSVKFGKGFVPPVHITYTKQYIFADPSQVAFEFEFDAGENPRSVRTWQMEKEFTLAGHTFTLTTINALPSNTYEFNFTTTDSSIYSVGVVIEGHPLDVMGGGMDASAIGTTGSWSVSVGPYRELPKGKLKVTLSHLWYIGELEGWTIDWQP